MARMFTITPKTVYNIHKRLRNKAVMRDAIRKLVFVCALSSYSLVANSGVLALDDNAGTGCDPVKFEGGIPAISKLTTAADLKDRLKELGNNRALVNRSPSSVRAIDLDYQICAPGTHPEQEAHLEQNEHLEYDKFVAESLLYSLFLVPVDSNNQEEAEIPLLNWTFKESYYSFIGDYVSVYQQTIGGVPIVGAEAIIEYGKYGEIKAMTASAVDIEIYLDLVSAFENSERLKSAAPPLPPSGLTVDTEGVAEPEMSVFIGRKEEPTAAWRYQRSQTEESDQYYDVVIDAESDEVLRDSNSHDDSDFVLADGVARIDGVNYEFPVDCTRHRENCKLIAKKNIANREISISVRTESTSAASPDFKSDSEEFDAPKDSDRAAAIFAYTYLWELSENLLNNYLQNAPNAEFPKEIRAIFTDPADSPGEYKQDKLHFARLRSDRNAKHGGFDRHIIGHEFVHMLLRSVPNPAIISDKCTGQIGEQFHAVEESLADVLALLLAADILDSPSIADTFGRQSLGSQRRNMKNPGKGSIFDSRAVEQRISDGETLKEVLESLQFHQPKLMRNMIGKECESDSTWANIKYVNMGVPNSLMYELITIPRDQRPGKPDNAQWRQMWIKTLMTLVYGKKLRCSERGCDNFCSIGFVIATLANDIHDGRMRQVVHEALVRHGINMMSYECPVPMS